MLAGTDDASQDLDSLRLSLMQALTPFLQQYIWNREAFELESSRLKAPPWQGQSKRQREFMPGYI